jgi:hypothetical protein
MKSCAISRFVLPSAARREICASLRGELVERGDCPLADALTGCLELNPRALCERLHPEVCEEPVRSSKLVPRVDPARLAPEPFAEDQVGAGQVEPKAGGLEPLDRLAVERLRGAAFREQRP